MKKLLALLKILLAGITAVAILCGIFALYYTLPVHIANPNGNTDYVWPANSRWAKMTEGLSWGRFDANGYNNLQIVENPDILILGSSHMEATNVLPTENLGYLLGKSGEYAVYNMGISGHNLIKVCKYLPVTLTLYEEQPEFIIIETATTNLSQASVDALLEGTVEFSPSHDTGLLAAAQRLPFVRLAYQQLTTGLLEQFLPAQPAAAGAEEAVSADTYDAFFRYIHDVTGDSDSRLIIVYHPTAELCEDGSVRFAADEGTTLFAQMCAQYGIAFLDMTHPFTQMYQDTHKLPHGFVTGAIGSGHLNADGHAAMARQLEQLIAALEQEG